MVACGSVVQQEQRTARRRRRCPPLPAPGIRSTSRWATATPPATSRRPNGGTGGNSTAGYAYQLAGKATVHGKKLTLVNFACAGATTVSILKQVGCAADRLGPGAANYPTQTQIAAATAFIAKHKADVGLITVSISGNDITSCAMATDHRGRVLRHEARSRRSSPTCTRAGPAACRRWTGRDDRRDHLSGRDPRAVRVEGGERQAARVAVGDRVQDADQSRHSRRKYDAVGATFVDITAATDGYVPFTQTTTARPRTARSRSPSPRPASSPGTASSRTSIRAPSATQ